MMRLFLQERAAEDASHIPLLAQELWADTIQPPHVVNSMNHLNESLFHHVILPAPCAGTREPRHLHLTAFGAVQVSGEESQIFKRRPAKWEILRSLRSLTSSRCPSGE